MIMQPKINKKQPKVGSMQPVELVKFLQGGRKLNYEISR